MLFLVAVCVSGYLTYLVVQHCKNRGKNKTFFFIQVCDGEDSVSWLLTSLPYLPAHYKVEASTSIFLTLTQNYFSATVSFSEALQVICKPLASEVVVLRELVIRPWKLLKARKILNNKHYCVASLRWEDADWYGTFTGVEGDAVISPSCRHSHNANEWTDSVVPSSLTRAVRVGRVRD